MIERRYLLIILGMMFCFVLAERLVETFSIQTLSHDGAISYLAASGNQSRFQEIFSTLDPPYAEWVPATEWKSMMTVDSPFCFGTIARGLQQYDIHPPLYFWLLHVWMLIFGMNAWTGPLLNTVLACLSAVVLYQIAMLFFKDRLFATGTALIWFASPAVIAGSQIARQYDLMCLLALCLIWYCCKWVEGRSEINWQGMLAVGLITVLGMLTHFHFALALAGCGFYLLFNIKTLGWLNLLKSYAGMAAGSVIFLLGYPNLMQQVRQAGAQSQAFNWDDLGERFDKVIEIVAYFFYPALPFEWLARVLLVLLPLALLAIVVYSFISKQNAFMEQLRKLGALYFFTVWFGAVIIGLYLGFLSPNHAMEDRYLVFVWPFLASVVAMVVWMLPRNRDEILAGVTGLMLCFMFAAPLQSERDYPENSDPVPTFRKAEAVLIDIPARGFILPAVYQMDDETMIFAAWQHHIVEELDELTEPDYSNIAYYNLNDFGNTVESFEVIMKKLSERYYLRRSTENVWHNGDLYFGVRSQRQFN